MRRMLRVKMVWVRRVNVADASASNRVNTEDERWAFDGYEEHRQDELH